MIFLAIVESDGPEARAQALSELLAASGLERLGFLGLGWLESGKPFLKFNDPQRAGYSLSKFRSGNKVSAVMALCSGHDIGVDAEIWPQPSDDPGFLASIAAPEDQKAVEVLQDWGPDAATALWVIKEAALKCCDEVAIDPRHVSVTPAKAGLWLVTPGRLAGRPFPPMTVQMVTLTGGAKPGREVLASVAVPIEKVSQIKVVTQGWNHAMLVTKHTY